MSQVFDALQRSGAELNGLDPAAAPPSDFDAAGVERAPSFLVAAPPEHRLVALTDERSPGAEKFRVLATQLRHIQKHRPMKTLLFTSSIKDEGKSLLSANLAISLAKTKLRILLIDCDCRQGGLSRSLGLGGSPGLTSWWQFGDPAVNYVRQVNSLPLWFLPSGRSSLYSVEMLQSARFTEMLGQATNWFDWVLIDSPPLAPIADSAILVGLTDATLLVVRTAKTPTKLLGTIIAALDARKLLGVVLNDCPDPQFGHYAQYYHATKGKPEWG